MAKPFDFGEIHLDTATGAGRPAQAAEPETPFRIALLGDFSGRANRGIVQSGENLTSQRVLEIDRDNFEQVMARCGVAIDLPVGPNGSAIGFRFRELDDFHPDHLYEQSGTFARLREIRERLRDPETFAAAAEELGLAGRREVPENRPAEKPPQGPRAERPASGHLLDQMIEETESRGPEKGPSRAPDELQAFVNRVSEPHLVKAADPRQRDALTTIERAIGVQMRALLHVPEFQNLEAAWRAVFLLVRRIETNQELKLYLIDISKEELAADLGAGSDLRASGLYRLLVEKSVETPGAEPWALLAVNYAFGPGREDAELLGKLAKIAAAAGAPLVAGASPELVGCRSFGEQPDYQDWRIEMTAEESAAWAALRGLPEAASIGLVMPRFLLRLPYGEETDAVESFPFEEMGAEPSHEDYLWGNGAFACALLLAESFSEAGWKMRAGMHAQIDGLPLDVRERDGQKEVKPCAEALLTERAAERVMERGIMPLVTVKGQDAVRIVRFQSIAEPLRALAGHWDR